MILPHFRMHRAAILARLVVCYSIRLERMLKNIRIVHYVVTCCSLPFLVISITARTVSSHGLLVRMLLIRRFAAQFLTLFCLQLCRMTHS